MSLNLPPLPVAALAPPPLPVLRVALAPLAPVVQWSVSPAVNPAKPGWCVCRWRVEFPECRMYWDGVWWCTADAATGELARLERINITNWSCEWRHAARTD